MHKTIDKAHFNFGANWHNFSQNSLTEEKLIQAQKDLESLLGQNQIKNKSFLDIGAGSGIFSIAASKLGAAKINGFDISPDSVKTAISNNQKYNAQAAIIFKQASILDIQSQENAKFDIVYSWGVLHHTGDMWTAIRNACKLVNKDGLLVIAIYNKHWSSPIWKFIKKSYNLAPKILQRLLIYVFYIVIIVAKFAVTGKNPFRKKRGMNFYYDVIDWIGGYPYEYASTNEVVDFLEKKGFKLNKLVAAQVPTGCNEFIFTRNGK